MGVLGILRRNKITQRLGMPVGDPFLVRLQASSLWLYQRMGSSAGVFSAFCLNFESTFFPEQLKMTALIIIAVYYGILV